MTGPGSRTTPVGNPRVCRHRLFHGPATSANDEDDAHDCQRINQRESADPATGRGRRSAADGLDRRRSTRRHQFPVDRSDLDLDRYSPSRGASENPGRYRTPVRAGEKILTCADWATAKAGALKAVPGGTDYRVETDADGASYEAFMTKAATAANASMPQSLQK